MALKAASPAVGPLIESFSFLAIVTSFIGFILGLSDFLCDALPFAADRARVPAYALTLIPAYFLALAFPDIFFAALDTVRPPLPSSERATRAWRPAALSAPLAWHPVRLACLALAQSPAPRQTSNSWHSHRHDACGHGHRRDRPMCKCRRARMACWCSSACSLLP